MVFEPPLHRESSQKKTKTIFHYVSLYFSIFHYILLYFTICFYMLLYFTIFHYILLYTTMFHYVSLYYTILHYITLYSTIFYYISLYSTMFHYIFPCSVISIHNRMIPSVCEINFAACLLFLLPLNPLSAAIDWVRTETCRQDVSSPQPQRDRLLRNRGVHHPRL